MSLSLDIMSWYFSNTSSVTYKGLNITLSFSGFKNINPISFYSVFIVFGTYFAGSNFSFTTLGVYSFPLLRADFINRLLLLLLFTLTWELLLLLTLTCELLFGLFWTLELLAAFLPSDTLLIDKLLFNFFSLFDFLIPFLLSGLLPFLGSIDLWGDLLLDLLSLGSFLALFSFVGDFCSLEPYGNFPLEFAGLLDLLRASFWSGFLFYRNPRFISNKIINLQRVSKNIKS